MLESIQDILIRRDGITEDEANDLISEAKNQFYKYLDSGDMLAAEEICAEFFGLESDYLDMFI